MFKREKLAIVFATVSFLLFVLNACSNDDVAEPQVLNEPEPISETEPSPTPDGLENFVVGFWEWQGEDGWYAFYDFLDNGTVIVTGSRLGTYEVVSENTILANIDDEDEEWILRIRDFQDDNLTIENRGTERTYHRIEGIPNLNEAVVGLWIGTAENNNEDGYAIEFAPNGTVIAYYIGPAQYRVLSENSIEIYDTYRDMSLDDRLVMVVGATDNTLTLYQKPGETFTLSRVTEHANLAEGLVGLWRTEDGEELEFTGDGRFIIEDSVGTYQVVSNNTIMIGTDDEVEYYNIVDLDKDSFSLESFGQAYVEGYEPTVFTKVQR